MVFTFSLISSRMQVSIEKNRILNSLWRDFVQSILERSFKFVSRGILPIIFLYCTNHNSLYVLGWIKISATRSPVKNLTLLWFNSVFCTEPLCIEGIYFWNTLCRQANRFIKDWRVSYLCVCMFGLFRNHRKRLDIPAHWRKIQTIIEANYHWTSTL